MDIDNIKLKNMWRNCNNSSFTFAASIPLDVWTQKPFAPRFSSYSWEVACILRTRLCYLDAFKTGSLYFTSRDNILDKNKYFEMSKTEVLSLLKETAESILDEVSRLETFEKLTYFMQLLQHKRIHHGKLLLYHSKSGLELPKSFKKTWGESNFTLKRK
jgi:hypothetical protein